MSGNKLTVSFSGEGKNIVIAYALWFFLGYFGVHRFYLGKVGSGVAQLVLLVLGAATSFILIGAVPLFILGAWWVLDAYFVYKYVQDANRALPGSASSLSLAAQQTRRNDLDELHKLFDLYKKGALTEEEYLSQKNRLMAGSFVPGK